MPDRPDPDRCLDALAPEDRAAILRLAEVFGLAWTEIPPLRQLVEFAAVFLVSADVPVGSGGDAVRRAAAELGLEDDGERATHPADRYPRTLRNWHAAAGGKSFRARDEEAA